MFFLAAILLVVGCQPSLLLNVIQSSITAIGLK
jgi:hypothetical protein